GGHRRARTDRCGTQPGSADVTQQPAAIVTGAGAGIGLATAHRLHRLGMRLVLVDTEPGRVRQLAAKLGAVPVVGDVADPAVSEQAVRAAASSYGRLDLLHLNAGRMTTRDLAVVDLRSLDLAAYLATVGANMDGVVFGIRAALPVLHGTPPSAIVVTASLAGLTPFPPDPIYTMTKHAVVGLVRSLAELLAAEGITICALCPGFVDTPLIAGARHRFTAAGFPLISAEHAAAAVEHAWRAAEPGALWALQPGREPVRYRPAGVPGPARPDHGAGGAPLLPPLS
ncbi:MAG TPA: SDR family NAD(P)-dependent oxidoreductase, partial [Streptosporangiaceae bacterium]|nr:SDR family NAD(P)-dependent oxidoreductase [Streptosporangiaceae bacterium]